MAENKRAHKPKWKREVVLPTIARIIDHAYWELQRFITRDEIVALLAKDAEARKVVGKDLLESESDNMVDWFSSLFIQYQNKRKGALKWGSIFDRFDRTEHLGHAAYKPITSDVVNVFPDEVTEHVVFREGAMRQVLVNAYERDSRARDQCIAKYGAKCFVCDFSFGTRYGKKFERVIHVHHLRPLSTIRKEYVVDPIEDLRPVCPNCHAILHAHNPAYTIEQVREFLA